ncbi:ribosomal protein L17 [Desulfarculus baarsii DSM 2075]|uniref:Large ribosomal subunit protein bL17 n=1 Tax=Desulfarculus baarsii (strain ATCC 33931 / DSM 2075 / LMG 7858 / VKM B-1802 / 2st14) TaxID=644282 RepID=E1QKQ4_DESB2|nr:50S ribosomal protein L17 [Desulfarculus baarsii]ADK86263.1 ribosomal protein L17 [Desulfarculus baarsii DSM 2075]
MKHRTLTRKLSRDSAHRKAMMRNLVTALFEHDKVETTHAKAKELKKAADKMITLAKRGDLHARRLAEAYMHSHTVCGKLFAEAKDRYQQRSGGYVRVVATRVRRGDAAPMAIVELVSASESK